MSRMASSNSIEQDENEQLEALLIECIRLRPVLYDRDNEEFRNNDKKEETWREISNIMDVPVHDCKVKWIRLREYFARFLRCNPKTKHYTEVKKPWVHLERMWWLKNFVRKRKVKLTERRMHNNLNNAASESFKEIWDSDVSYLASTEVVLEESVTTSDLNEDEETLEMPDNAATTEIYYPGNSHEVTINRSYKNASSFADERDIKKRDHKYAKQEQGYDEVVTQANAQGKVFKKRKEDRFKDVADPYGNQSFCGSLVPMLDQLSPEHNIDCKIAIMNIMKQFITK